MVMVMMVVMAMVLVIWLSYIEGVDGHHLYHALRGKESIPECHLSKWERRKLVTRKNTIDRSRGDTYWVSSC